MILAAAVNSGTSIDGKGEFEYVNAPVVNGRYP
jgi:hypothetical protein